jgi:signal transduction histidine kinase
VLSAASHDLRTPLAAIAGYAELLASEVYGPVTPAQRDVLQRIGIAKERLLALVGDILEAARAEAGRDVQLHAAAVEVAGVCADLDTLLAPQAAAKGIDISVAPCEVPPDGGEPVALRGDPARVLQILVNVASNAIAHTPAGGRIGVRVATDDAWVRIGVWDSGPGIPPELHETIFQPFVQVGGAGLGGVGLGLATSRSLARRMGGDVTVESAPGAGSTFTLRMPRATD